MERSEVYRLIDGERAYQQAQGKLDSRTLWQWVFSLVYYVMGAKNHESKGDKDKTLIEIRKIAALAVAALEQYGCPPREGYEGEERV